MKPRPVSVVFWVVVAPRASDGAIYFVFPTRQASHIEVESIDAIRINVKPFGTVTCTVTGVSKVD